MEPSEAPRDPQSITGDELLAELREMHGENIQDLATARVIIRKQKAMIEGLQDELVKKTGDAGGTS